jgi:hypothetical protein
MSDVDNDDPQSPKSSPAREATAAGDAEMTDEKAVDEVSPQATSSPRIAGDSSSGPCIRINTKTPVTSGKKPAKLDRSKQKDIVIPPSPKKSDAKFVIPKMRTRHVSPVISFYLIVLHEQNVCTSDIEDG